MKRVILLRDYNGLPKGTELFLDEEKNMYKLEEIEENIGDSIVTKFSRMVAFSRAWVESLFGKLFEDPDDESKTEKLIKKYEDQIAELQAEVNWLIE